jgi:hypothetical protein
MESWTEGSSLQRVRRNFAARKHALEGRAEALRAGRPGRGPSPKTPVHARYGAFRGLLEALPAVQEEVRNAS